MIGWTIVAVITLAFLLGLIWLGKEVTDSWGKSAAAVGVIVTITVALVAAIYGADALIKAGI